MNKKVKQKKENLKVNISRKEIGKNKNAER